MKIGRIYKKNPETQETIPLLLGGFHKHRHQGHPKILLIERKIARKIEFGGRDRGV